MLRFTTAPLETECCLFIVGMQCRKWTSLWKLPFIARSMGQMQRELRNNPDSGFIWGTDFTARKPLTSLFLSYWKSVDHINAFVNDEKYSHLGTVRGYIKRFAKDPHIGLWHETYEITPQNSENLYIGMAPFGVSAFTKTVDISQKKRRYFSRLGRKAHLVADKD